MSYSEPHSPKKNRIEDVENGVLSNDEEEEEEKRVNGDIVTNESVMSTRCEVSQTSVGLASESVLESSLLVTAGGGGREEADSATVVSSSSSAASLAPMAPVSAAITAPETKEIKLSEANAAVIGQQPPVESLNVKQV